MSAFGIGIQSTCLDINDAPIACSDPSCFNGPCSSAGAQSSVAGPCATGYDSTGESVGCTSPLAIQCYDANGNEVFTGCGTGASGAVSPNSTGALSSNAAATGGGAVPALASNGTGIASIIGSLATIGTSTYISATAPPKTSIGLSGISVPSTSSTTLLLIVVAVIVGFVVFYKKG